MTSKDQHKLIQAGFTIVRRNELLTGKSYEYSVKFKTPEKPEWHGAFVFANKKAFELYLKGCYEDPKTVVE